MITRAEIVAEARSWVGTPWHHCASKKTIGCDCIGLLRGVATALGNISEEAKRTVRYSETPDGVELRRACEAHLIPVAQNDMQIGDVVLLAFNRFPQHLGILGDYRTGGFSIIHASNDRRLMKVVEMRLMFSTHFRFVAAFKFPGVA